MITGIINVNKPKGLTSHDVVSRLRRILKIRQIGHTGTLDPLAVGVLPICVGKATKIIQYLDTSKAYRAYILLGIKTDSYDTEGEVLEKQSVKFELDKAKSFLQNFQGEITQTPPMYSAVHYKGKRLYEYARKNIAIEDIPTRKVTVNSIELVDVEKADTKNPVLVVDIDCSGGTYIRSIAYDLGEKLGCGACLEGLTRTKAGKFRVEDSFTLEQIEELFEKGEVEKFLQPPVLELETIEITPEQKEKIHFGQFLFIDKELPEKLQLFCDGELVAIAKFVEGKIKPVKVFC